MWPRTRAGVEEVGPPTVQPYVYRPVPDTVVEDGQQNAENGKETAEDPTPVKVAEAESTPPQIVGFNEEEVRVKEEQARALGMKEGEAWAGARFDQGLTAEREAIAKALRDFAREREGYFYRVEAEVVKLAVEIARKILHREVQVDPLLLAGVVRVALEKIAAGTSVRLRIHPEHVYAWHDFFANQQNLRPVPELLGDGTLGMGHCVLETALGTTDLALESQLAEVERGFFDLLAQRPVTT
jgi:flagellar assembly protein FliH